MRQSWTQDAGVSSGEEQSGSETKGCHGVAVSFWHSLDQAVQAESSQVVGDLSLGHGLGILSQERSQVLPHVLVGETVGQKAEQRQRIQQGLRVRVVKPDRGSSLMVYLNGLGHFSESVFADGAVMADSLDVKKTSVGLEADSPQSGEIVQPFADAEVAGVIDGGFSTQGASFFVVLLDAGVFVVHV